jgi:hypothetical protein
MFEKLMKYLGEDTMIMNHKEKKPVALNVEKAVLKICEKVFGPLEEEPKEAPSQEPAKSKSNKSKIRIKKTDVSEEFE